MTGTTTGRDAAFVRQCARDALEVHASEGRDDALTDYLREVAEGRTPSEHVARMVDTTTANRGSGENRTTHHAGGSSATERQRAFLESLLRDRTHAWATDSLAELEAKRLGRPLTKGEASRAIDYLKSCPRRNDAPASCGDGPRDWPRVDDGRYAVPTDEGHLAFYRVINHRNGRIYVHVYASDVEHDVPFRAIGTILRKIAESPREAMERYGRELGHCGRCGRTLTDEESRRIGIGPVCRAS